MYKPSSHTLTIGHLLPTILCVINLRPRGLVCHSRGLGSGATPLFFFGLLRSSLCVCCVPPARSSAFPFLCPVITSDQLCQSPPRAWLGHLSFYQTASDLRHPAWPVFPLLALFVSATRWLGSLFHSDSVRPTPPCLAGLPFVSSVCVSHTLARFPLSLRQRQTYATLLGRSSLC